IDCAAFADQCFPPAGRVARTHRANVAARGNTALHDHGRRTDRTGPQVRDYDVARPMTVLRRDAQPVPVARADRFSGDEPAGIGGGLVDAVGGVERHAVLLAADIESAENRKRSTTGTGDGARATHLPVSARSGVPAGVGTMRRLAAARVAPASKGLSLSRSR